MEKNFLELILKNFWLISIAVIFINGIILKVKSQKYIQESPELKTGYDMLLKGWLIYGNIPWVIMGIGNLTKYTNTLFDYCNPKSFNPFVLIFHLSLVILWILLSRWIYFKGGAEFMEKHPGLFVKTGFSEASEKITAKQIKISVGLNLLGGGIGMALVWIMDISVPKFLN
ncbi:MAG: hypothetical protein SFU98_13060 [Leptospiraceae bacterium]|nr:hypothetical protein [Leptospiraceae bacterium]